MTKKQDEFEMITVCVPRDVADDWRVLADEDRQRHHNESCLKRDSCECNEIPWVEVWLIDQGLLAGTSTASAKVRAVLSDPVALKAMLASIKASQRHPALKAAGTKRKPDGK